MPALSHRRIAVRPRLLALPPALGRLPLVAIAAGLVLWWLWPGAQEQPARVPVPLAGTRTLAAPLLLDLVIDESGSTATTDTSGRRHTEAEEIGRWLARYSENPADRIGVVRFAGVAVATKPISAVSAPSGLAAAIRNGDARLGSGTLLAPAVAALERQLRPYPGYRRVVVILSDGQVRESPEEVAHLVTRLRAAADSVYFVGLNGDGEWRARTHEVFENRGLADVLTLERFAPNEFAQTLAQIVLRETGQRVADAHK